MQLPIYVVGDSHSRAFANNENFFPLFVGAGKEHCFVDDSVFDNLKKNITQVINTLPKETPVLLFLGEPDTRFYLGKGWTPWNSEEPEDISNYQEKIDASFERYKALLTHLTQNYQNEFWVLNITPSERENQNKLVDYFNHKLQTYCQNQNILFFHINTAIYLEELKVNPEYMGDVVHTNNKIQLLVEKELINLGKISESKYNQETNWDNSSIKEQFDYNEKFGCYTFKSSFPTMVTQEQITIDKTASEAEILRLLKEYGVVIIPEFIDSSLLKNLQEEFHEFLNNPTLSYAPRFDYSLGESVRVDRFNLDNQKFPATAKTFSSNFMKSLTRQYLGNDFNLNSEIFVVKDVVGSKHIANDLHFDVLSTFKFFIYLNDTTAENGAFSCVPGSQKHTATIRAKYGAEVNYENRDLTRDLPFKEEQVIPIEAKAGSMIIFDTDVFHRAGTVHKGERWVMRGHSRINKSPNQESISLVGKIKRKLKSIFS